MPAWKEPQQGERAQKEYTKDPGHIIVGQHRRLPLEQGLDEGENLALGRHGIAGLVRQARGEGGRIARIRGVQTTDMGA